MTPQEAAAHLRPDFHLVAMPPEDRHHVVFVEAVATELGVEHTPFNLYQVAEALDRADIHADSNEYPKMLYARRHHAVEGIEPSTYDKRHDHVWTHVADADQAKALGAAWVENPADLPPRGDTPVNAEQPEPVAPPNLQPVPFTRAEYEMSAASSPDADGVVTAEHIEAAKKWLAEHPVTPPSNTDPSLGHAKLNTDAPTSHPDDHPES